MSRRTAHNTAYRLYVVRFSDNRIKIGISGDVQTRMDCFIQEARRSKIDHVTWWACAPLSSKRVALLVKKGLRRSYSDKSIPTHRDWLLGITFREVIQDAKSFRASLGEESGRES